MGSTGSKQEEDHIKVEIKNFNDELQRAIIGCGQARNTFLTLSDLWCSARRETVDTLSEVAQAIDRRHQSVNIASLGGTTSCIAGGTAGIVGVILAPVTGGLSTALAAGGILGTVAGSATVFAANVAEVFLTKELMEKVQKVLDADALYTKALRAAFKEVIIHENEVITLLTKMQSLCVERHLQMVSNDVTSDGDSRSSLGNGNVSVDRLITLVSCFFSDDEDFLQQLKKTQCLVKETPTFSAAVPNSSEFFQALKEVSSVAPETLKSIGETAFQSSVASSGSSLASFGAQLMAIGLGAIFIALDVHKFIETSKNYDEGSKTELAEKIRNSVTGLKREAEQVEQLIGLFKRVT